MTLSTEVQRCSRYRRAPASELISCWAGEAFSRVTDDEASVTIRIVDREEGAELNKRYRNRDRATNVLSFDYSEDAHAPTGVLGDIVICAEVVDEEAKAQKKDLDAHWAHMVVHGILHLCGYDHARQEAALAMEKLEADILSRLGFADPYS